MKKNILITGITGFVGSHLADFIIKNKKKCKIYGIKRWYLSHENLKHIFNKIHFFDCDITDPISVENLIRKINLI